MSRAVLIVEDDTHFAECLEITLEMAGYNVCGIADAPIAALGLAAVAAKGGMRDEPCSPGTEVIP